MTEKTFIQQYVIAFIAAWTAANYADACMRGELERLNNPPVEDAEYLAKKAWKKLNDVKVNGDSVEIWKES